MDTINTFDIFRSFGYTEHRRLKQVVSRHAEHFKSFGDLYVSLPISDKKRGGQEKGYLLNEAQFILLVLLAKNTPESIFLKQSLMSEIFQNRINQLHT